MEQINRCKTEVHNQNSRGITDNCPCQYRISTRIVFNQGLQNILPILYKGKSPPYRSRIPGKQPGRTDRGL
ncbi:MAG: hypothetical protein GZ094_04025 [Mariniphaga sp.]|nr:hypothetical protein [Mariniphaga sp.]